MFSLVWKETWSVVAYIISYKFEVLQTWMEELHCSDIKHPE